MNINNLSLPKIIKTKENIILNYCYPTDKHKYIKPVIKKITKTKKYLKQISTSKFLTKKNNILP